MAAADVTVSSQEVNNTLLLGVGNASSVTSKDIKEALERGDTNSRIDALQKLIRLHMNGEPQNHMIMTVIKFITPLDDHVIKKLVLYFWEVIDKTDKDGNLLSVIILICSFLRNDLQHPNEFVRGLTLRFLCKLKERDLLEPLVSAVVQNLTHSVTYVRRNAVLAVHSIYRKFPELLPDAPELVYTFICEEHCVSAQRNAFDMLAAFAPDLAAQYLLSYKENQDLSKAGGCFLMSVVDFCRQMIRANPYDKAKYVPILFSVLQTNSPAVRYQCATTLLSLSSSPTAIKQAALTFIDLLKTHSDNSVRLIVIEQLDNMRARFLGVLQDSLMDVLSALDGVSLEARPRIVALAVELISSKNTEAFVQAMKKELQRTQADHEITESAAGREYRLVVIRAISSALVRYPKAAPSILPVLLDYACDGSTAGDEVVTLIKEVVQVHPSIRAATLRKLMDIFPLMSSPYAIRTVLWIFGVHVTTRDDILRVLKVVKDAMGPLPLAAPVVAATANAAENAAAPDARAAMQATTTVREDGTYVTTYVPAAGGSAAAAAALGDHEESAGVRTAIIRGDYFLASVLSSTLTKLIVQLFSKHGDAVEANNEIRADAIVLLDEILRYGLSAAAVAPMDDDAQEHIRLGLSILSHPRSGFIIDVTSEAKDILAAQIERREKTEIAVRGNSRGEQQGGDNEAGVDMQAVPVNAPLIFTQLMEGGTDTIYELEASDDASVAAKGKYEEDVETYLKKIENTMPLSGFCDPVYCEARVDVHQFEVSVDWLIANRTSHFLHNLTIELASLGGMKLCERPQSYSVPPHGTLQVRTSLKVSATESGVVFGNVLYDAPNGDRCCVILNDIHVDIMNYIKPADCQVSEFRTKWCAFDWENKINVSTDRYELRTYIDLILRELNMHLMDDYPEIDEAELEALPAASEEVGSSEYMSCNLYARTVFGEDALANVSVERDDFTGVISGVVRIRSNTKALAYGIGEKLTLLQKQGKV